MSRTCPRVRAPACCRRHPCHVSGTCSHAACTSCRYLGLCPHRGPACIRSPCLPLDREIQRLTLREIDHPRSGWKHISSISWLPLPLYKGACLNFALVWQTRGHTPLWLRRDVCCWSRSCTWPVPLVSWVLWYPVLLSLTAPARGSLCFSGSGILRKPAVGRPRSSEQLT
jgi:hypothetical protein